MAIAAKGCEGIWVETASILKEAVRLYESRGHLAVDRIATTRCDRVYLRLTFNLGFHQRIILPLRPCTHHISGFSDTLNPISSLSRLYYWLLFPSLLTKETNRR